MTEDPDLPCEAQLHVTRLRMGLVKRGLSKFLDTGLCGASPLAYVASLVSADPHFRVVTSTESMLLTNALLRSIAGQVIFIQCHVQAKVAAPDEFAPDDSPVERLDLNLLVFPHDMLPYESTSLWAEVRPEDIPTTPLTFGATARPAGWPR